ncbi:MAG: TraB/GumN family protein [Gammaproteobacteria bacterium]|nr:TraB/GumN family protein [Gammaproteobacteria bacterium]
MIDASCSGLRLLVALAVVLFPFGLATAEPAVWAVTGKHNTVYLFGSVHLLPEGGFAIAGELERAYRDSDRVCFEVDIGALTPATTLSVTLARAVDPEGRGLYELLGPSAARVREAADTAGIDLSQFAPFEPWFAGISVSVLALQQRGFVADHGVEQIIHEAADRDGKPGCGLETLDEQLALLDGLAADEQQELLLQSLEEAQDIETETKQLFEAWRDGDDEPLARQFKDDFADYPELAERLIFARNARWADQVVALLKQPDDVLVVVGALHLVGDRGLPALLEGRGLQVDRR